MKIILEKDRINRQCDEMVQFRRCVTYRLLKDLPRKGATKYYRDNYPQITCLMDGIYYIYRLDSNDFWKYILNQNAEEQDGDDDVIIKYMYGHPLYNGGK